MGLTLRFNYENFLFFFLVMLIYIKELIIAQRSIIFYVNIYTFFICNQFTLKMGCISSTNVVQNGQIKHETQPRNMATKIKSNEGCEIQNLLFELTCNEFANIKTIRNRQIMQHLYVRNLQCKQFTKNDFQQENLIKCHFQRVFMDIVKKADEEFINMQNHYQQVMKNISKKYIFEFYRSVDFVSTGARIYTELNSVRYDQFVLVSDRALLPILRDLRQKYPQVYNKSTTNSQIQDFEYKVNLLNLFPSRAYASPDFHDINSIFYDMRYLIDKANQEYEVFKQDMSKLLGGAAETKIKIKKQTQSTKYSAFQSRELMIRWVQNLLESCPQTKLSKSFIEFMSQKNRVVDNVRLFERKPNFAKHQQEVLRILAKLLDSIKYQGEDQKNIGFGFYIYDLLSCRLALKTESEISQLVNDLKKIKKSPQGKLFEVTRIVNRLGSVNSDVVVNFRYGQCLVAEIQLCLAQDNTNFKKTNSLNDYLSRLQKSLFGPTIQLLFQYQESISSDMFVSLCAVGEVRSRKSQITRTKYADRRCPNKHQMIEISANSALVCDFCEETVLLGKQYQLCLQCGTAFCKKCETDYKKSNMISKSYDQSTVPSVKNKQQLEKYVKANRSGLVMFYKNNAASQFAKDYFIVIGSVTKRNKENVNIVYMDSDLQEAKQFIVKFKITKYPTFVVLNKDLQCVKAVVGASLLEVHLLESVRQEIAKDRPAQTEMYCGLKDKHTNKSRCKMQSIVAPQNWQCFSCSLTKTDVQNKALSCKLCGIMLCTNCAFAATKQTILFEDINGTDYLATTPRQADQSVKCTNGHKFEHSKIAIKAEDFQYKCSKCGKNFYFSEEAGMGYCKTCPQYCCSSCTLTVSTQNTKTVYNQVSNHFSETSAATSVRCTNCTSRFKLTYNTNKCKNGNKVMQSDYDCSWCNLKFDYGTLHLSCFQCDISICFACSQQNHLMRQLDLLKQLSQQTIMFQCPKGHQILKVNSDTTIKQDYFQCTGCAKRFYTNSVNYRCDQCKLKYCANCAYKSLNIKDNQKCELGHQLQPIDKLRSPLALKCNINFRHLIKKGESYWYCQKCDYSICNTGTCTKQGQQTLKNKKCNEGHPLTQSNQTQLLGVCNQCLGTLNNNYYTCDQCEYDICRQCAFK